MENNEQIASNGLNAVQTIFGGHFTLHYCNLQENKFNHLVKSFHDNSFCDMVKLHLGSNITPCTEFDMITVRTECLRRKQPFFKICSFGAFEIITPFFEDNELKMVLFHGPFRLAGCQDKRRTIVPNFYHQSATELDNVLQSLPEITLKNADLAAKLCMAMSENFIALCHHSPQIKSRKDRIKYFMSYSYRHKSTSLDSLADYLNLSISRTGKVLQQEFNITFPQMLNQYRFDNAKKLLCETALTTGIISELSGFSSPQYFYRLFRKTFNITPTEYRKHYAGHHLPEDV